MIQHTGELLLLASALSSLYGFSVGMEAFDELLSINVPWSGVIYLAQ